jgi:hypothetical protein
MEKHSQEQSDRKQSSKKASNLKKGKARGSTERQANKSESPDKKRRSRSRSKSGAKSRVENTDMHSHGAEQPHLEGNFPINVHHNTNPTIINLLFGYPKDEESIKLIHNIENELKIYHQVSVYNPDGVYIYQ